ncbi:RNA polymerase subunit AC19 [Tilletia horrida]|uniref:DNA-directed RNA polymerases I and III subunit RPAC2 n=1 Tax=Tilletia horrida TaxID=155126 RepID=A0AAN6GJ06_9BASI|nr:RNA polymerase subunit AC19 [Tilletia horrida]KAK0550505.1 RNA polymerase subunit AC19 [Tilletia horrida]
MAMTDSGAIDWIQALGGKVTLLPGFAEDLSAATFCLAEEDHTLGNSLRYMLMKDPRVEFCGYSLPHPSELKCHLRVQMYGKANAVTALQEALIRLEQLFESIKEAYQDNLAAGEYEMFEEQHVDMNTIRQRQEEARAAAASAPAARASRK